MILRFFFSASSISSSACGDAVGEGLLHEDVLAVFQRFLDQRIMRRDRGDHRDGVDLRESGGFRGSPWSH